MKLSRLAIVAAVTGSAATAQAQTVHFVGSNTGCFYVGSTPCMPGGSTTTAVSDGYALSYTGSTFDAFTSDGFLGIGNEPGTPNVDNLGSFSLANATHNYQGTNTFFTFQTAFTSPTSENALFVAIVNGSVHSNGSGGLFIDFDNSPQFFDFNGGSFMYSVNDVSLTNGASVQLSGQIEVEMATVPEPSSMALLGTGLVGLVPMIRRRKK